MKKLLAVLLAVVMLFSVATICSSAEETPKVTIVTNQGSSILVGDETYFTVSFDDFTTIKGMDVDVTVTNATGLKLEKSTGFTFDLVENGNYKSGDTALKLVDLTGEKDGKLIFKVKPTAVGAKIEVEGEYAKSGTELVDVEGATATLDVVADFKPEETTTNDAATELAQPNDDTFIPYCSVLDADGKFVAKDPATGAFALDASKKYTYSTFTKPSADAGLITYGVSNEKNAPNNLRFGTYSVQADTYNHGTLIFEGKWEALRDHYIQKGYTIQEFVKAIYKNALTKIEGYDYVSYKVGSEKINVYIVPQTKVMWQSEDGKTLEYAVRVNNASGTYTGIAYSYSKTNSEDIKISVNARTTTVSK